MNATTEWPVDRLQEAKKMLRKHRDKPNHHPEKVAAVHWYLLAISQRRKILKFRREWRKAMRRFIQTNYHPA